MQDEFLSRFEKKYYNSILLLFNMSSELIYGLLYVGFDKNKVPSLIKHEPSDLSEEILKGVRVRMISLLAEIENALSDEIMEFSFPAINLKAIGSIVPLANEQLFSLLLLYNLEDDLIYYKYKESIVPLFIEAIEKIKNSGLNQEVINKQLSKFNDKLIILLDELQDDELSDRKRKEELSDVHPDYRFKLVIGGEMAVGKTSLVLQFTDNAFKRNYLPTIGANILDKNIFLDDNTIQLVIFDIAGHQKFETMRKLFYKGLKGVFLVFDLTNKMSFKELENWHKDMLNQLSQENASKLIGFLIGNKNDLTSLREVDKGDAMKLADEIGFTYIETSALTGENVEYAFKTIAKKLLMKEAHE